MLSLIVAHDNNKAIGYKNSLLWHLPKELKLFKEITYDSFVIMGSKTFDSLPGLLKSRTHVVITRSPDKYKDRDDILIFKSLETAIEYCKDKKNNVFVIGGASIYKESLDDFSHLIESLHITVVDHSFEKADTYFPEIPSCFVIQSSKEFKADKDNIYSFTSYLYKNKEF